MDGDAQLVARVRHGDRQAFDDLYDRYADDVFSMCLLVLGDPAVARAAAGTAFALVARTRMNPLSEPSRLRSWLLELARGSALAWSGSPQARSVPVPHGVSAEEMIDGGVVPAPASLRAGLARTFDRAATAAAHERAAHDRLAAQSAAVGRPADAAAPTSNVTATAAAVGLAFVGPPATSATPVTSGGAPATGARAASQPTTVVRLRKAADPGGAGTDAAEPATVAGGHGNGQHGDGQDGQDEDGQDGDAAAAHQVDLTKHGSDPAAPLETRRLAVLARQDPPAGLPGTAPAAVAAAAHAQPDVDFTAAIDPPTLDVPLYLPINHDHSDEPTHYGHRGSPFVLVGDGQPGSPRPTAPDWRTRPMIAVAASLVVAVAGLTAALNWPTPGAELSAEDFPDVSIAAPSLAPTAPSGAARTDGPTGGSASVTTVVPTVAGAFTSRPPRFGEPQVVRRDAGKGEVARIPIVQAPTAGQTVPAPATTPPATTPPITKPPTTPPTTKPPTKPPTVPPTTPPTTKPPTTPPNAGSATTPPPLGTGTPTPPKTTPVPEPTAPTTPPIPPAKAPVPGGGGTTAPPVAPQPTASAAAVAAGTTANV
jgi:DNA-directed RNA polymerase specialized sigma24 family protein